ncbi:MAG: PadR family transcriptional regulator [Thermoanaerobaculia bacterium]|nr:PadR family transcriptional regulator [Thermoanaerobaculia bacterium]
MKDLPTLSGKERTILELLVARGEMYGLQLVEASPEIKRGAVYATLDRMMDKGFVEISHTVEDKREGGLPRKLYRATVFGSRILDTWKLARAAQAEASLRDLLLQLPKDGKKFEHLVRLALEELLDRRVWPARSGAQFGADMGSGNHHWPVVRLEAKRYQGSLKKRELLGELDEAIREEPALDLWILATTTEVSEQLASALTDKGERLGIGIEIVDLSDSRYCKLPLLLASALEPACEFVGEALGGC